MIYDLVEHLKRQRAFSTRAFGPGLRTKGVSNHIRKELIEIENAPTDLEEWGDVILLGLDGAQRLGVSPEEICEMLLRKLTKNENRVWPDWRQFTEDDAIPTRKGERMKRYLLYREYDGGDCINTDHFGIYDTLEEAEKVKQQIEEFVLKNAPIASEINKKVFDFRGREYHSNVGNSFFSWDEFKLKEKVFYKELIKEYGILLVKLSTTYFQEFTYHIQELDNTSYDTINWYEWCKWTKYNDDLLGGLENE